MTTRTGSGFAAYVISLIGCAYGYGIQGVVLTEALLQQKARRYPKQYTPEYIARTRKNSLGRVAFDCTTPADLYTGLDKSASGWLEACQKAGGKTAEQNKGITWGPIATMPEIVGLTVYKTDHMGNYIGKGEVVEARGVDDGVVQTKLSERGWVYWAKLPGLDYGEAIKCPYPEPVLLFPYLLNINGTDARWFQWHLIRAGYDCGVKPANADKYGTDGYGYKKTWAAISDVQNKSGLGYGDAGPKTRVAIKKAAGL